MRALDWTLTGRSRHGPWTLARQIAFLSLLALALLGSPRPASAGAIYLSDVTVNLAMGMIPAGVGVANAHGPQNTGAGGFGNFTASSEAGSKLVGNTEVSADASADGTTAFPPASFAFSFADSSASIGLVNANFFAVNVP